jgi:hypothetical protein
VTNTLAYYTTVDILPQKGLYRWTTLCSFDCKGHFHVRIENQNSAKTLKNATFAINCRNKIAFVHNVAKTDGKIARGNGPLLFYILGRNGGFKVKLNLDRRDVMMTSLWRFFDLKCQYVT